MASTYYVIQVAKCTWIWLLVSKPLKFIMCNVNIAMYWLKSQTTSHSDSMYSIVKNFGKLKSMCNLVWFENTIDWSINSPTYRTAIAWSMASCCGEPYSTENHMFIINAASALCTCMHC